MSEKTYTIIPIGYVQSPLNNRESAPKQGYEGAPAAWLVFNTSVREGLGDLQVDDEVLVLTWLRSSQREVLSVHPRDDLTRPLCGVFSTRSADRPNPIGLHRVRITAIVDGIRFQVQPLEALNQTPIIDVKPLLKIVTEA